MDYVPTQTLEFTKVAAFVDELVKIAAFTGDTFGLEAIVPYLTHDQEEMLKQAGMGDWLDAAKAGAGRVGTALAGAGQKVVSAIQGMGAGGAQARMMAAGAEHEGAKAMAARSAGAMPKMKDTMSTMMPRSAGYNPARVDGGLMQQAAAEINTHAPPTANSYAMHAPPTKYNPTAVSAALSPSSGARPPAIPAMAPRPQAIPAPRQPKPIFGSSLFPSASPQPAFSY